MDETLDRVADQLKKRAENCKILAGRKPAKARAYLIRRADLLCALAYVREVQMSTATYYVKCEVLPFIP